MSEFEKNPGQNQICLHRHGPRRVNAGAGTGKTTSLVLRVKAMLEEDIPARHILVLTFTKKAAEDQKSKMRSIIGMESEDITVGNFHSIALTEIRENTPIEESFHILDSTDAEDLWKQGFIDTFPKMPEGFIDIVDEVKEVTRSKVKPSPEKKWKLLLNKWSDLLKTAYSNRVNQNTDKNEFFGNYAIEFLKKQENNFSLVEPLIDLRNWAQGGFNAYLNAKNLHRAKDFDDIIVSWIEMLKNNPTYKHEIQNRWTYVIVDEYQDTNFLQEELLRQLNTTNLMVVGDTAQCLYTWRQAAPELMIEFPERYKKAEDITLNINYRSYGRILEFANDILKIHHNSLIESRGKSGEIPLLQLQGQKGPGGDVRIFNFKDPKTEANRVVDDIEKLIKSGEHPKNIAVLSRTSFYLQTAESFARTKGINTQVWGGRSLLESKTVKQTMALLKSALRPKDPNTFKRIASIFPKIGEKAATRAFLQWQMDVPVPDQLKDFIEFLEKIQCLRKEERENRHISNAMEIADEVIEFMKVTYHTIYGEDDWKQIQELEALSDAFIAAKEAAQKIIDQIPKDSPAYKVLQLDELISQMSLNPLEESEDDGAVTFSTIHQAKGMEWRHIFIMGVAEGTLPIIRKGKEPSSSSIQEECRGFYVAITRAMETLTVTYSGEKPSRFLTQSTVAQEIKQQSIKKWRSHPQWMTPPEEEDLY